MNNEAGSRYEMAAEYAMTVAREERLSMSDIDAFANDYVMSGTAVSPAEFLRTW